MAEIRLHPEALEEYQVAREFYRSRSLQAANRFEVELDRILSLIMVNPELFPRYDDEHRFALLRRFPFSVVYSRFGDQVYVVALAHSRRSAGYWHERM